MTTPSGPVWSWHRSGERRGRPAITKPDRRRQLSDRSRLSIPRVPVSYPTEAGGATVAATARPRKRRVRLLARRLSSRLRLPGCVMSARASAASARGCTGGSGPLADQAESVQRLITSAERASRIRRVAIYSRTRPRRVAFGLYVGSATAPRTTGLLPLPPHEQTNKAPLACPEPANDWRLPAAFPRLSNQSLQD